ncbi:MAG: hypothetical protein K0Q72_4468, partial [Armatimonadetes bacterium]|nr:hypothetical protein [Armatimonadota bacterium]
MKKRTDLAAGAVSPRRRATSVFAVTALALSIVAGQLTAQAGSPVGLPATITGNDAEWFIQNDQGTSNGDPVGGSGISGPGLGTNDARLISTNQGDAFDGGMTLWVNNDIYVAPPSPTVTPSLVATDPAPMSGLNVSVEYYALTSSPTLRMQAIFQNPSPMPVSVTATLVSNLGSDSGTTVVGTSSGDATFTAADDWIVTDDGSSTGNDPAVTHFLAGATGAVQPSSVSQTVFSRSGTEGILANYPLTVPGNSTRRLVFFVQLNTSSANGVTNAAPFAASIVDGNDALSGIGASEQSQVVNFDLDAVDEGGPVRVVGSGNVQIGRVRGTINVNAHRLANGQAGGSLNYTESRTRSIRGYRVTGITRVGNTVTLTGLARISGGSTPGGTFTATIVDNGATGDEFSISAGGINVGPLPVRGNL